MQRTPSEPHHEIVDFLVGSETRRHVLAALLAKDALQKIIIESKGHAGLRQTFEILVTPVTGLSGSVHSASRVQSSMVWVSGLKQIITASARFGLLVPGGDLFTSTLPALLSE
jgi:hypothetical protein